MSGTPLSQIEITRRIDATRSELAGLRRDIEGISPRLSHYMKLRNRERQLEEVLTNLEQQRTSQVVRREFATT